jgi:hypothetical protein
MTKVRIPTITDVRRFINDNTWIQRDPETGRHRRNGHLLELGDTDWRCQHCQHTFDAAVDADLYRCGDPCQHPGLTTTTTAPQCAPHAHLYEWLEIDWGIYVWICACGEIEWP